MQNKLDYIDQLIAELNALQPMSLDNKQRLDKKFRLEFNYNSNHLEGNTLTYGETQLLLLFDDTKGNHTLREYEEMKAHDIALKLIKDWAVDKERPLTETNIKNLNEVILVRPFWKEAITPDGQNTRRLIKVGNYKEQPNSVRLQNGELFEYASPTETPILMGELITWYRDNKDALHPVTLAAMFHYKFVRIHPFDDGNGRVSRLLMNYVLYTFNLPPIIIKSKEKDAYLRALRLADIGEYEAFITYIADQLQWSLEVSIKAAKGESIEDTDDFDKEIELLKRMQNPPREKIKKSEQIVLNTLQQVYFPLIQMLDTKLTKLNKLFSKHTWTYFKDSKPPKYGRPLLPSYGSVNDVVKHLQSVSTKFDDFNQQYKVGYWLMDYNDQDDFSLEVSLKIYFNETDYIIHVFIGQPFAGGMMMKAFGNLLKLVNEGTKSPFDLFKDYPLIENEYHTVVLKEDIESYANQISKDALAYIKQKVSGGKN